MALLQSQGLPASDITDEHLRHFFFTGSDSSPTGFVGIELYGTDALPRSLIVVEPASTGGIGSALVQHAEDYATSHQVSAPYLLTTTAGDLFERRGYCRVDRSLSPPRIKSTSEFAQLCPASSAFMIKRLPR
jgi:amino-acid N-acetyltransferase